MPKSELLNLGLLELKAGDWIMARSLHNQGDPEKDILQGFVPGRDLFNQEKWSAWLAWCKEMLGPQETRTPEPGSTPFEQFSNGSRIKPVTPDARCYQTGFTYERPKVQSGPNANSKLEADGSLDELTQKRALLNKLGIDFALDNFAECPPYMRETFHELAEAVNMPRLAHKDNCMWPSSQVNLAVPQRHESRQGLVGMGHFGGAHTDEMDLAAGRFHLLSLGVYVDLANIHVVFFSGRLHHSGTPPLAPQGVEEIAHWAYHFVLILYPASKLLLGTSKIALSATTSGNKSNDPHTVPPEVFHPKVPFPTVTHATLARDGGIIMDPEEHFTCTKRMFAAMLYHGLRQLPYNLHVDMQQIMDSITAHDPKINNGEPYKGRGWDYLPNSDVTWEPLAEDSQRSREVFPGRREVFERFYNELHVPHAQCVLHIGVKDVALYLPEDLRFLAGNEHAPVKQKKLSKPAIPKGKKKSQKVQNPLVIGQTGYLQMQTTRWAVSRDMIAEDEDMDENEEQGIAQPEMDVDEEEEEEQEQEQEDDDAHRGHEELSSGDEGNIIMAQSQSKNPGTLLEKPERP
ncbi:hypothetical protein FOMPIDRAFT_1049542 [Fomitopsis schrenkii]|uniref:Uncharacterized protein n=1 Tax=Fomitopsis schrenkii TaxID=2126942 RepID=S8E754_FOMSC|nr:hypothetical protein FOMPIDRAFT_1049542 [Fomitopsis schrenkii]